MMILPGVLVYLFLGLLTANVLYRFCPKGKGDWALGIVLFFPLVWIGAALYWTHLMIYRLVVS